MVKKLKIRTSWDDGKRSDIKLADLLRRYKIPAVFYIPTQTKELTNKEILELTKDFEIGGHTQTHVLLTRITLDEAKKEIDGCFDDIFTLTRKEPKKFCYPRGYYNKFIEVLVQEAGFEEARTVEILKFPDHTHKLTRPTTIHAGYQRKEYGRFDWTYWAELLAERAAQDEKEFSLWGHSQELTKYDEWQNLEDFFKVIINEYELI